MILQPIDFSTDTLRMRVGETIKFRIIGTDNNFICTCTVGH